MGEIQINKTLTGAEWVTLSDMKLFLKVDYDTDDTLINSFIKSAREIAEQFTNKSFAEYNINYCQVGGWDSPIKLPYPNHLSVTDVTINGEAATFGTVGTIQKIVSISSWGVSTADGLPSELKINYKTKGDISDGEKSILKKIVAEMYENRSATVSDSTLKMLFQYKVY